MNNTIGLLNDIDILYKRKHNIESLINLLNYEEPSSITIIESGANINDLVELGCGAPNCVYKDKTINLAVKIPKGGRDYSSKIIARQDKKNISRKNIILSSEQSIDEYIELLNKSDIFKIDGFDENYKMDILKKFRKDIINYMTSSKIINKLETFLKFKGIVIYRNICYKHGGLKPLIVPAFEFLENHSDDIFDLDKSILNENMINIIKDFKIYNSFGYIHKDLQNNCRNMVSYQNNGITKLKVIDLDNPIYIFNDYLDLGEFQKNILCDYLSLLKCLLELKLINNDVKDLLLKNINIVNLVDSLDLDITVVDTTIFKIGIEYPKHKLIVSKLGNNIIGELNGIERIRISTNNDNIEECKNIEITRENYYDIVNIYLNNYNQEIIHNFIVSIYDSLLEKLNHNL